MKKAASFASGVLMLGFLLGGGCSSTERKHAHLQGMDQELAQLEEEVVSEIKAAGKSEASDAREQRLVTLTDLSLTVRNTRFLGFLLGMQPDLSLADLEEQHQRIATLHTEMLQLEIGKE